MFQENLGFPAAQGTICWTLRTVSHSPVATEGVQKASSKPFAPFLFAVEGGVGSQCLAISLDLDLLPAPLSEHGPVLHV